jgi:serine/threonine protein kinase
MQKFEGQKSQIFDTGEPKVYKETPPGAINGQQFYYYNTARNILDTETGELAQYYQDNPEKIRAMGSSVRNHAARLARELPAEVQLTFVRGMTGSLYRRVEAEMNVGYPYWKDEVRPYMMPLKDYMEAMEAAGVDPEDPNLGWMMFVSNNGISGNPEYLLYTAPQMDGAIDKSLRTSDMMIIPSAKNPRVAAALGLNPENLPLVPVEQYVTNLELGDEVEIHEELGEGTFFKGLKVMVDGKMKVIKIPSDNWRNEPVHKIMREKIIAEVSALSRLSSSDNFPKLDTTYPVEQMVDENFLAEKLVKGDELPAIESLSLKQAEIIAYQVLAAVTEAHRERIIHNDIKPENVRVTIYPDDEDYPLATLMDLGEARLFDTSTPLTDFYRKDLMKMEMRSVALTVMYLAMKTDFDAQAEMPEELPENEGVAKSVLDMLGIDLTDVEIKKILVRMYNGEPEAFILLMREYSSRYNGSFRTFLEDYDQGNTRRAQATNQSRSTQPGPSKMRPGEVLQQQKSQDSTGAMERALRRLGIVTNSPQADPVPTLAAESLRTAYAAALPSYVRGVIPQPYSKLLCPDINSIARKIEDGSDYTFAQERMRESLISKLQPLHGDGAGRVADRLIKETIGLFNRYKDRGGQMRNLTGEIRNSFK